MKIIRILKNTVLTVLAILLGYKLYKLYINNDFQTAYQNIIGAIYSDKSLDIFSIVLPVLVISGILGCILAIPFRFFKLFFWCPSTDKSSKIIKLWNRITFFCISIECLFDMIYVFLKILPLETIEEFKENSVLIKYILTIVQASWIKLSSVYQNISSIFGSFSGLASIFFSVIIIAVSIILLIWFLAEDVIKYIEYIILMSLF